MFYSSDALVGFYVTCIILEAPVAQIQLVVSRFRSYPMQRFKMAKPRIWNLFGIVFMMSFQIGLQEKVIFYSLISHIQLCVKFPYLKIH